jgi:hypothetical protein
MRRLANIVCVDIHTRHVFVGITFSIYISNVNHQIKCKPSNMQELKRKVNDLTDDIQDYLETFYELKVHQVIEKSSIVATQSMVGSFLGILTIFILTFSGIALALWIGKELQNYALGFLVVSGIYLFMLVIILLLRKSVIVPKLRNFIIKKMYE